VTLTPSRGRFNVSANERHVSVNVLATYDPQATLVDIEEAIKDAARAAVYRARSDMGQQ
jgi:hypothetical protein